MYRVGKREIERKKMREKRKETKGRWKRERERGERGFSRKMMGNGGGGERIKCFRKSSFLFCIWFTWWVTSSSFFLLLGTSTTWTSKWWKKFPPGFGIGQTNRAEERKEERQAMRRMERRGSKRMRKKMRCKKRKSWMQCENNCLFFMNCYLLSSWFSLSFLKSWRHELNWRSSFINSKITCLSLLFLSKKYHTNHFHSFDMLHKRDG